MAHPPRTRQPRTRRAWKSTRIKAPISITRHPQGIVVHQAGKPSSVKRGPRVGHTGASHAMTSGKQGMMRPGNQFRSGGLRNPRAGGSSQGGRRNRHLNRSMVLGSPKVRQKPSQIRAKHVASTKYMKTPRGGKIPYGKKQLPKIPKSAKVAQQRLSNEYNITTYNLDGTVSTSPDYGEGEIR